jgi:hypothetical protein
MSSPSSPHLQPIPIQVQNPPLLSVIPPIAPYLSWCHTPYQPRTHQSFLWCCVWSWCCAGERWLHCLYWFILNLNMNQAVLPISLHQEDLVLPWAMDRTPLDKTAPSGLGLGLGWSFVHVDICPKLIPHVLPTIPVLSHLQSYILSTTASYPLACFHPNTVLLALNVPVPSQSP